MSQIQNKIKSLRETIGRSYNRPDPNKLKLFQEALKENKKALEHLSDRGLSDSTIEHFGLGYSKEHNGIAIPIYKNGELINIKYRLLKPKDIKYISERGAETWIYNEDGIQKALNSGAVLIVEGEFDLMSAYQRGIRNVVSPAMGKDSYGVWLELLDNIPKIFIAYDNDEGGKKTAIKLSDRLGVDKCFEVAYPDGIKDANEYFKNHSIEEFRVLVKEARPFYKYQFKGLGDIINILRTQADDVVSIDLIPKVEIEKDWLLMVSGKSNIGKTAYVLNVADKLSQLGHPVLILPYERGVESVGKRFLQVKFDKSVADFGKLSNEEWDKLIDDCVDVPLYLSLPKKSEIIETIIKARRLFNIKFIIIDHFGFIVKHASRNEEAEISSTLENLKIVAEENSLVMIIVSHIRKIDTVGEGRQRKPSIEDLKGSSSLYQNPEVVVMLTDENGEQVNVDILKNKGEMTSRVFDFNKTTGKFSPAIDF